MANSEVTLNKKIFCVIVVLMPLLNGYSINGIPGSLADIGCLILILIIINSKRLVIDRISWIFVPYLVLLLLNNVVYILLGTNALANQRYYIRIYAYIFVLAFGVVQFGDLNYAIRVARFISIITSIYCWMQYFSIKMLNMILPSYLPFFEHRNDLDLENSYINYKQFYRPHSIFTEPSVFCEYILICLVLLLSVRSSETESGQKNKSWKITAEAVFITATCFITGSSTGIVGAVIVWGLYIARMVRISKIRIKIWHFILLPVVAVTGIYIIQSSTFWIFVQRFFVDKSSILGRFDGIRNIASISFEQQLFGCGFAFDSVVKKIGWIPGFALVLVYFGIIGLAVLFYVLLELYRMTGKNNLMGRMLFFLFVIMNVTSYPLFSAFFVTDLFFILLAIVCAGRAESQAIKTNSYVRRMQ